MLRADVEVLCHGLQQSIEVVRSNSDGDVEVYVPLRVVANGAGSEVLVTVFRQESMNDKKWDDDATAVSDDLETLKALLKLKPDVVVEAAGSATAFDEAVGRCARGGTIVLVSTTWEPITVSFMRAQMREVTLVPAFVYGEAGGAREFDTAAAMLASHSEWAGALITHRFPLADAREAFRVAADRAHGALKVVLEP